MQQDQLGSVTAAKVLRAAYDHCRGRYLGRVTYESLGGVVGLSREEFARVVTGLCASGYARDTGEPDSLTLEHAGLDWVEYNPPADGFPYTVSGRV